MTKCCKNGIWVKASPITTFKSENDNNNAQVCYAYDIPHVTFMLMPYISCNINCKNSLLYKPQGFAVKVKVFICMFIIALTNSPGLE